MSQAIHFNLNDGKQIPALAWGNGTGGLSNSGKTAVDMGVINLKYGVSHIDTAQGYGTEKETGEAINAAGAKRDTIWVTTKVSPHIDGKPCFDPGWEKKRDLPTEFEAVKKSVQESIDRLGSRPNLLLIHSPYVAEKGKIGKLWTILEDLVNDGTLKDVSLGVSNFVPHHLEEVLKVAKIKPACHQLEYHPYLLAHLKPVLDIHAQHNIVAEAYGPLTPVIRHPGGPLKPVLEKIAKAHDVDTATVLLRWTMQSGVVAVTSSKNEERIKGYGKLWEFELSSEEVKEIEEAGKKVHFRYYAEHMVDEFPVPNLPDGGEDGKKVPTGRDK